MSEEDRCVYCLKTGHRASHCPMRPALEVAQLAVDFLNALCARFMRMARRKARKAVCAAFSHRQVHQHNVLGRFDEAPRGVWKCTRCERVSLGAPVIPPPEETP